MKKISFTFLLILTAVNLASGQGRTATVISERANLRETPSQIGEVKQEVAVGSTVKILDQKGAWYVVRIGDSVGWMHGNTFRIGGSKQTVNAASQSPSGDTWRSARSRPSSGLSDDSGYRPSSGREYIRGSRGGCYYLSGSGRKVYVDRSLCN
jgi:hypothetical protein